jgi:hypothetical protein
MFNPLREALSEILQKGKDKGLFRKDADWVNLYVSISGLEVSTKLGAIQTDEALSDGHGSIGRQFPNSDADQM